jgi:hypothetical protein
MEPIIAPVDKSLLSRELTPDRLLRRTNRDGNEIYEVTAHEAPNVMHEIGRIRELAFRSVGSGTGKSADIDQLDTGENPYTQLIVWNPLSLEIMGGYRYKAGWKARLVDNRHDLGTARLFMYSQKFIEKYLPHTIELGRSFIAPEYQSTSESRKALFVLDNLWNGLGALINKNANLKYFIGQVSLYKSFDLLARDLILYFFKMHCGDADELIRAREGLSFHHEESQLAEILNGHNRDANYRILSREVRARGENIPPLMNTYLNLSPSMRTFGTVDNPYFKNMEDTGIMITIGDIYTSKIDRHI